MQSLYERVIRSLLVESKVDTVARSIVQEIIAAAKALAEEINEHGRAADHVLLEWPENLKRMHDDDDLLGIKMKFSLVRGHRSKNEVRVGGHWLYGKSEMMVEFEISSTDGTFKNEHLPLMQQEAYSLVRHELEHSLQNSDKISAAWDAFKPFRDAPDEAWKSPDALVEYYTSDAETEAYVAGLYHKAKRTRKPFVTVVDEMLALIKNAAISNGIEKDAIDWMLGSIKRTWMMYAMERFPKAQLSSDPASE